MAFPVRIYKKHPDEGGKVRRIITTKMLDKRLDALIQSGERYSTAHIPAEGKCPECKTMFWISQKGQKYCSRRFPPHCGRIAEGRNSVVRSRGVRAAKKKQKTKEAIA